MAEDVARLRAMPARTDDRSSTRRAWAWNPSHPSPFREGRLAMAVTQTAAPDSTACLVPLLTLHGRLRLAPAAPRPRSNREEGGTTGFTAGAADDAPALPSELRRRLEEAFERGAGHGLLSLGAGEVGTALPAVLGYWRELGRLFVTALCTAADAFGGRERGRHPETHRRAPPRP